MKIEEKYGFRIRVDVNSAGGFSDKDKKVFDYADYEIELSTHEYLGQNYDLSPVNEVFTRAKKDISSTSARDYYFYSNITAFALNVPINLTIKFYDAQDNYVAYSNTLTFTIADLALIDLADAAYDSVPKLKTLYVDMLNYGTAAQVYFSKGTSGDLSKAAAINLGSEAYQEQYATKNVPSLNPVSEPNDLSGSGFLISPNLQIQASNNIYYRFTVPAGLDVENLSVTLNHTDLFGVVINNTYDWLKGVKNDERTGNTVFYCRTGFRGQNP